MTNRYWTDEEIEYLRENYQTKSALEIGKAIDRTENAVFVKCNKLGFKKMITDEQVDFIERNICNMSVVDIAKTIGKTPQSVRSKMFRSDIPTIKYAYDGMTMSECALVVHKADSVIGRTWVKRGLKYKRINSYNMVANREFIRFCKENQDLWDATDCEQYYFLECDWFEEKRKRDFERMVEKRWGNVSNGTYRKTSCVNA